MIETLKKTPSKEGQILFDTLRRAVANVLEIKRRLGEYAVDWRDIRRFDAVSGHQ